MIGVSKYVLACMTPNVVSRGLAPNIARGKRNIPCFVRVFVHNVSSPALKHHHGTMILV